MSESVGDPDSGSVSFVLPVGIGSSRPMMYFWRRWAVVLDDLAVRGCGGAGC